MQHLLRPHVRLVQTLLQKFSEKGVILITRRLSAQCGEKKFTRTSCSKILPLSLRSVTAFGRLPSQSVPEYTFAKEMIGSFSAGLPEPLARDNQKSASAPFRNPARHRHFESPEPLHWRAAAHPSVIFPKPVALSLSTATASSFARTHTLRSM